MAENIPYIYRSGDVQRRLRNNASKKSPYVVVLPDFVQDENGEWAEGEIGITTIEELREYREKYEEIYQFLKETSPESIAKIYCNALRQLTSRQNSTIVARLLSGKPMSTSKIYVASSRTGAENVFFGLSNTLAVAKERLKTGENGKDVKLKPMTKNSSQIYSMFKKGMEGYYIPQIDKDGLVVGAGRKDHFDVNFLPVGALDVNEEQLMEYFKAPFPKSMQNEQLDEKIKNIVQLCKKTFKEIGGENWHQNVREIVNECMKIYPLSFVQVKEPKKRIINPIKKPEPKPEPDPAPDPDPKPDPGPEKKGFFSRLWRIGPFYSQHGIPVSEQQEKGE